MARPKSELTQLINTLPTTLSAAEVVAKVKERGLDTTENNVHRVRKSASTGNGAKASAAPATKKKTRKRKAAKAAAAAKRAKKTGTKVGAASGGLKKSDLVRSFPQTTPAKEVVASAKAKGITLNEKYVYKVRTADRKRTGKKAPKAAPKTHAVAKGTATAASMTKRASGAEAALRTIASEIGFSRSMQILESEHRRLMALLGS